MDKSRRFLFRMIGFLIAVVLLGIILFDQAIGAFKANPALNSLILGVLLIGIIHAFRQVLILDPEAYCRKNYHTKAISSSSKNIDRKNR